MHPLPSGHCIRSLSSCGQLQRLSSRRIFIGPRVFYLHQLPCRHLLKDRISHFPRNLRPLRFRRRVVRWQQRLRIQLPPRLLSSRQHMRALPPWHVLCHSQRHITVRVHSLQDRLVRPPCVFALALSIARSLCNPQVLRPSRREQQRGLPNVPCWHIFLHRCRILALPTLPRLHLLLPHRRKCINGVPEVPSRAVLAACIHFPRSLPAVSQGFLSQLRLWPLHVSRSAAAPAPACNTLHMLCPSETFAIDPGSLSCTACPDGATAPIGSSACTYIPPPSPMQSPSLPSAEFAGAVQSRDLSSGTHVPVACPSGAYFIAAAPAPKVCACSRSVHPAPSPLTFVQVCSVLVQLHVHP